MFAVSSCPAHLAKGLEFGHVSVANASDKTFKTDMDRNLLYVGCTRAMHRLSVFSSYGRKLVTAGIGKAAYRGVA